MSSLHTFNTILLPSIEWIQKTNGEIIKSILKNLLRSREKEIMDKGMGEMGLLCVKPLLWMVLSGTRGFLSNMEHLRNLETSRDDKSKIRLIAHAKRTL